MTRFRMWTLISLATGLAAGCANSSQSASPAPSPTVHSTVAPTPSAVALAPSPVAPTGDIVARANGTAVTRQQLIAPLTEAYGLNVLLNLVQLELAEQDVARGGDAVSEDDVRDEYDRTLAQMFKEADKVDYDGLLDQMLTQQKLTRAEFEIVMRTNANLRKIAAPWVNEKVTETNMRELFNLNYGEKVRVRHIQTANLVEWSEARRRVESGEPFADVARALSRNARTKQLGGVLPPFSRQATDLPEQFKSSAFALKVGELSEAVSTGTEFHLIKLEERIEPRAVKYEDMEDVLRQQLVDQLTLARVAELRRQMGGLALRTLTIEDPALRRQWEDRLKQQETTITGKDSIRKQLEEERRTREADGASTPASPSDLTPAGPGGVQEVTAPPTGTGTASPEAVSPERPPATQPAP